MTIALKTLLLVAGMLFAQLTFTSTQSQSEATPFSATGGAGTLSFAGSLETGTPCYTVSGGLRQSGKRVTVTVTAQPTDGFCSQVITNNNYQGQVTGLAAGTYDFRIVHAAGGGSSTVYTQSVTVS